METNRLNYKLKLCVMTDKKFITWDNKPDDYSFDSSKNQRIKSKFIEREVLSNQTSLISELLSKGVADYDDIENLYYYRVYLSTGEEDLTYYELEAKIKEFQQELDDMSEDVCKAEEALADAVDDNASVNVLKGLKKKLEDFEEKIRVISNYQDDCEAAKDESEMHEIFEWWLVSDFMLVKLLEQDECILETECGSRWGRCATGQAILLDYSTSKICFDMEILDGQKYEW